MRRFRIPVLAVLVTASALVTVALGWFGWKNLEQETALAGQVLRERLENTADTIAAGIRGKLVETGERLSQWISSSAAPSRSRDGSVIIAFGEGRTEVIPRGAIPFVPVTATVTLPDKAVSEAEAIEFGGQPPARAANAYRKLSQNSDPRIRAEALMRLGRVLRKSRDFEGATDAYRSLAGRVVAGYACQLADASGRRVAGAGESPPQAVSRIIGDSQNAWMLRIWPDENAIAGQGRLGPRLVVSMVATVILFLWGTVYFMARAIRREAAVARLQSDFVAAVSHEFRSPPTTVRQLSEMLEMGQVPNEERRHKYYRVLAGEAKRLQRLVETLLNFGKMEAGAQQYHFRLLDVLELIDRAVREAAVDEESAGRGSTFTIVLEEARQSCCDGARASHPRSARRRVGVNHDQDSRSGGRTRHRNGSAG